jgi:hypothetical protein
LGRYHDGSGLLKILAGLPIVGCPARVGCPWAALQARGLPWV